MLTQLLLIYLLTLNALGCILMLADKIKARKKRWRIPEATLFLVAAIGGSIGILIGMYAFRHKTRHFSFVYGMPLILAVQVVAVVLILG